MRASRQLWCPNGTYSAHGQLFLVPLTQVGGWAAAAQSAVGQGHAQAAGQLCLAPRGYCMLVGKVDARS